MDFPSLPSMPLQRLKKWTGSLIKCRMRKKSVSKPNDGTARNLQEAFPERFVGARRRAPSKRSQ